MKKLKDFFRNNLGLKLLSLAIAMLLWLLVINVSKPEVTASRTVKLEVENADVFASEGKTWELENRDTVQISFKARTDQVGRISAEDFRAYIDLEDYSITGSVPVYVEVLNNKGSLIDDVEAKPHVIKILIEDIQQKRFDLTARTVGAAAEGYAAVDVFVSPETVYATGPESEIGKISSIGVEVDVNGLNESQDGVAKPVFYDANRNRINMDARVSLSHTEIEYTVRVHKEKEVNLAAHVIGTPASGYQYEGVTLSPDSIQLSAMESVIDKLDVINLPAIDISGASSNVTRKIDVADLMPAGVQLTEPGSEVVVTVRVAKMPEPLRTTEAETETSGTAASTEAEEESREAETEESAESTAEASTGETEQESTGAVHESGSLSHGSTTAAESSTAPQRDETETDMTEKPQNGADDETI